VFTSEQVYSFFCYSSVVTENNFVSLMFPKAVVALRLPQRITAMRCCALALRLLCNLPHR
jgi:hypothetical protein